MSAMGEQETRDNKGKVRKVRLHEGKFIIF